MQILFRFLDFKVFKNENTTFLLLGLLLFFLPFFSFASNETFPAKEIFFQTFNFLIFAIVLFFLIRKPVKVFFHKRQEEFLDFEKQAFQLEKEKREEQKNWEKKIQALRDQEKGIEQKAQAEGKNFIFQRKEEIRTLRERLKKEADFFIRLEREKSKRGLLERWKNKVVEEARLELEKQALSPDFQKERLKDFFKQMESRFS